jgi:hypothetical protein
VRMQSVDWATGCLCKVNGSSSLTNMFSERSSGFQLCCVCTLNGAGGMSSKYSSRGGIAKSDMNRELLLLNTIDDELVVVAAAVVVVVVFVDGANRFGRGGVRVSGDTEPPPSRVVDGVSDSAMAIVRDDDELPLFDDDDDDDPKLNLIVRCCCAIGVTTGDSNSIGVLYVLLVNGKIVESSPLVVGVVLLSFVVGFIAPSSNLSFFKIRSAESSTMLILGNFIGFSDNDDVDDEEDDSASVKSDSLSVVGRA